MSTLKHAKLYNMMKANAENKMLIKFTLWMSQIMLGVSIALRLRERDSEYSVKFVLSGPHTNWKPF